MHHFTAQEVNVRLSSADLKLINEKEEENNSVQVFQFGDANAALVALIHFCVITSIPLFCFNLVKIYSWRAPKSNPQEIITRRIDINEKVSSKNSIWCHCASKAACRTSTVLNLSVFRLQSFVLVRFIYARSEREKERWQILMNIINVKSNKLFLLVLFFWCFLGSRCRLCYLNPKL